MLQCPLSISESWDCHSEKITSYLFLVIKFKTLHTHYYTVANYLLPTLDSLTNIIISGIDGLRTGLGVVAYYLEAVD